MQIRSCDHVWGTAKLVREMRLSPQHMDAMKEMNIEYAQEQATKIVNHLRPHTHRIEIAGSVRRKALFPKDIEIVMIPTARGLWDMRQIFKSWNLDKGQIGGRYVKVKKDIGCPFGVMPVDLFFATKENFGLLYAIRTGSANFSKKIASRWASLGYHSDNGILHKDGKKFTFAEEEDLFRFIGMNWIPPERRI